MNPFLELTLYFVWISFTLFSLKHVDSALIESCVTTDNMGLLIFVFGAQQNKGVYRGENSESRVSGSVFGLLRY